MNETQSELPSKAEHEQEWPGRNRLDAHFDAIAALRRKRWPFRAIQAWLLERSVRTSLSNLHSFWRSRLIQRQSSITAEKQATESTPAKSPAAKRPAAPDLRWGIPED